MSNLFTYTTSIEPSKTVGEILGELVSHGARQVLYSYDKDGNIESLSFKIDTSHGILAIKLPCDPEPVLKVLEYQKVPRKYLNKQQALRVAWRIVLYWTKAQMALLDTEMVKMEQIFLPYIMMNDGRTLYEKMVNSKFQLTEGKN